MTVPAVLRLFINVPVTEGPVPPASPVIVPDVTAAVQVYVVPDGTIPLVIFAGVTVKADSLQTVAVMAVTEGLGFTVTVTVNDGPVHVPAGEVGVTV